MKKIFSFLFYLFFLYFVIFLPKLLAQIPNDGMVLHITFDNCTVKDETGNVSQFHIYGNPKCVKGVNYK